MSRWPWLVLLVSILAGCAGYRAGWASVAYVGETVPGEVSRLPRDLGVPALELRVRLNNDESTDDDRYWFGVPVAHDRRRVATFAGDGKLQARITVTPQAAGWVFRPGEARFHIDGSAFAATHALRSALWDEAGNAVRSGGRFDVRDVGQALALEPGQSYQLTLVFDAPIPAPQSARLVLDLSNALRAPDAASLPPIRFAPVRWKQGYT